MSVHVAVPGEPGPGMPSAVPDDLLARARRLPLARRVELLTGASGFTLHSEPAIGLHELRMSDGPTGVRGSGPGRVAALLPCATLLASTWDDAALEEVGRLLADEAAAQEVHVVLGPTINLHRTALGGRLFEMYSEDPLLTGRLAAAYVRGLQGAGVAACLKHLVANEAETERTTASSEVDEATLREVYLLPFEIAIADAHPWTVMAAYNDVNGVPATESPHLLREVLREEWGWDGVVVSDWGATTSAAPAAAAGLDLVMPGPTGPWGEALVQAVRSGEVAEDTVDTHLARLLLLARRTGALDEPRDWPQDLPAPASPTRRDGLKRLAAAGMTLLKDDLALPLAPAARVALLGRHALETISMGGGSAEVTPPHEVSIAAGLLEVLGRNRVVVADGVDVRERAIAARTEHVRDPLTQEPGLHLVVHAADGSVLEERTLAAGKELMGAPAARLVLTAEVVDGGLVEVGGLGVGDWSIEAGGTTYSFSLRTSGRCFGEESLAPPTRVRRLRLEAGAVLRAEVDVAAAFLGDKAVFGTWGLVVRPAAPPEEERLAAAVAAASACDVSVVVVGLTEEQETESVDKTSLRLPGRQDEMVRRVAAASRRTVVVVNAATPVLMPWLDDVDAVLWAGLPGQEGGAAVAAVLTGELEPTGRLVTTFPAADGAAPAWSVQPVDGVVRYAEGKHIGHRGHAAGLAAPPAFWFGAGLGWSTWSYGAPVLVRGDGGPVVRVPVTNTGLRASREVVQLYLRPDDVDEPVRLVGYQPVTVGAGVTAEVEVAADDRVLRRWDTSAGAWTALGAGELLLARGLGDVRATLRWSPTS